MMTMQQQKRLTILNEVGVGADFESGRSGETGRRAGLKIP